MMNKFEFLLLLFLFLFSFWLMDKSFHYDVLNSRFLIARNEVGDLGLHLSLIRSFSYGNNFPPQLPFYPGPSLPYHYFFDFLVGIIERVGVRIDYAFNGLSALSFTALLYLLYKFPQMLFNKKSKLLGICSVLLFLFPSSFTFIDFFKTSILSLSEFLRNIWRLPDLIHKGPFDGSVISIFFTLNVYLNQRHLILALVISLSLLYVTISELLKGKTFSIKTLLFFGVILGISFRVHSLVFLGTSLILFCLFVLFKTYRMILPLFAPAVVIVLLQLHDVLSGKFIHPYFHPGFVIPYPLTIEKVFVFWLLNLGIAFFLIPLSMFFVSKKHRNVFLAFLPLFIIANIVQFSYRIEHNHSLFDLFFIFSNFYISYFLFTLWKNRIAKKIIALSLLFLLTFSGVLNLMAIKNDFRFPFDVPPKNAFMNWIVENTGRNDVFLAKAELLDPITISGRRNYLGNSYYLSVMGYDFAKRAENTKDFFEATNGSVFEKARKEQINYIVVPLTKVPDFNYHINVDFLDKSVRLVYKDKNRAVFKL